MPARATSKDSQPKVEELLNQLHNILLEQTNSLKNLTRPFIAVDLIPRHSVNALYLRVRNVGHTPAYGVRLSIDRPITLREKPFSELLIFQRPIHILAPQDDLTFFFDTAVSLYNNPEAVLKFTVQAAYADTNGTQYLDNFVIDAELMRGLAVELPPSDKIAEALDDIKDEIEDIAHYANELSSQDLQQRYRESLAGREAEGASESDTE